MTSSALHLIAVGKSYRSRMQPSTDTGFTVSCMRRGLCFANVFLFVLRHTTPSWLERGGTEREEEGEERGRVREKAEEGEKNRSVPVLRFLTSSAGDDRHWLRSDA